MNKLKIKEPNYIRDIKKEARSLGVKGKKNLDAYLKAKLKLIKKHNKIMDLMKVAFNVAREFVVGFLEMIFDWFVALAQYIKKTVNLRNRKYQYA